MKEFLRLYREAGGGNIEYFVPAGALGPVTATALGPNVLNDGLSVTAGIGKLGGPLGGAAAATLLDNREIPMAGFSLNLTGAGSLELTGLSDGNGTGIFSITTGGGQPFIHTGVRLGGFAGSLYIGYQAGLGAAAATGNIQSMLAVGQGAFQTYTSAVLANYRGVAIGAFVFQSQTSGVGNVGVGWASGNGGLNFSNNCLIGSVAGTNIDNGSSFNTMIGIGAGGTDIGNLSGGLTTANNCTLVGYLSGGDQGATTWSNVIMLGDNTGTTTLTTPLTNTTLIGSGLKTNVSNIVMLGLTTQNVLIGFANNTTDNGNRLQVNGNISLRVAGNGLFFTEGANGRTGQIALVAGTVNVAIASVTVNSRAFVTRAISNTTALTVEYRAVCTAGNLAITADLAAGTINVADISTLNYLVIN